MRRETRHRIRVRYAECDQLGVVFNANFFLYFDVAMTELWRDRGVSYADMARDGVEVAVLEATARYRAPAYFDDELDLVAEVTRLGTTSTVTSVRAERVADGTVLAEGDLRHVFLDARTHEKKEIPDSVRADLARFAA